MKKVVGYWFTQISWYCDKFFNQWQCSFQYETALPLAKNNFCVALVRKASGALWSDHFINIFIKWSWFDESNNLHILQVLDTKKWDGVGWVFRQKQTDNCQIWRWNSLHKQCIDDSENKEIEEIGRLTMMTSSNRNIFCITGHLCREFTSHWWIPPLKASDAELWWFLWSAPRINGWVNNCEAGDLRRHLAHSL